MPSVPFSDYSDTRLDADEQRCVNMYPHSKGGLRQFPGLVEFASFAAPAYQSDEYNTGSSNKLHKQAYFKDARTMYGFSNNSTTMYKWSMSADYDFSTVSETSFTLSGNPGVISGFQVIGSRMYVLSWDSGPDFKLFQFALGTAGDPETATYESKSLDLTSIPTGGGLPHALVSADETKVIVFASDERILREYAMTSPGNLNTASATGTTKDLTGDFANGQMVAPFTDPDNNKLFICDNNASTIREYFFGSPFSISTLTSIQNSLDVSAQLDTNILGANFTNNGRTLAICGTKSSSSNRFVINYSSSGYSLYDSSAVSGSATVLKRMGEVPYAEVGGNLYSFSSGGGASLIGAVAPATGVATNGTYLVLTTGGQPFVYSAANGIESITDTDLANCKTVAFVDSRFAYEQPAGQFTTSALDDPRSVNALDTATAESSGDNLLAVFSHEQSLYLCGKETIELWDTSGVGRPPLDRLDVIERGIVGSRAINSNDTRIYFLDQFRRPNVMKSSQYEMISSRALGEEFDSYSSASDCQVSCFTIDQENFVQFRFPAANKCWIYHEASGRWCEREDTSNDIFNISDYEQAYGKTLALDGGTGTIYEFSGSAYQDDGSNITRTIDSSLITSENYGAPGRQMIINGVEITVEASAGASMDVSIAKDGGSFSTPRTVTLASGTQSYTLRQWGRCREAIFRISTTSNAKVDFVGLAIDPEILND